MDEERVLVNDISGYIKLFNACEVGDCSYVKFLVDHKLREWCKFKKMLGIKKYCYNQNVVSFPKLVFYLKFQFLLAIDITDENGSTGLQIASANGHVSNQAVSKIMTIVTFDIHCMIYI